MRSRHSTILKSWNRTSFETVREIQNTLLTNYNTHTPHSSNNNENSTTPYAFVQAISSPHHSQSRVSSLPHLLLKTHSPTDVDQLQYK
jgi:hypothetical protein